MSPWPTTPAMSRSATAASTSASPGAVDLAAAQDEARAVDGPWCTVVWNDPVNLMTYVVFVFRRHFGYSRSRAEQLMRQVHEEGRAIVSRGSRERVERDVQAMHTYGLRATFEKTGQD